ncbi:hypothetical protein [Chryseobacterium sp.]|uniref:hypothetical protein n=1 Tax=Chryseobacterium sp. TaxID=1871047 RepID=UPI00289F0A9A|nr:hypothetical protein [Chryseobacterium sp.]
MKTILKNEGLETESFFLPPFELKSGEIVVIHLFNGAHFYETETLIKNIFCGVIKNKNVEIHKDLTFVEHFKEPKLREIFYPITVREYLKKNANFNNSYSTKIYETSWINKKTKVNSLAGNPRKLLSLYATLSKTNNIVFDLAGQDPIGAQQTYNIVKDEVKNGGSAILLDGFDEMKNDCTKYIELQWK